MHAKRSKIPRSEGVTPGARRREAWSMSPDDIPPDVRAAALTLLGYFVSIVRNEAAKVATNDNGAPAYYTAETCGIPPTTFRRLCRDGTLKGAKIIGRSWHVPRASFDEWRAQHATATRAPAGREDAAPATERSAEELLEIERREEAEQGKPAPRPRRR
ncbi:helix-turn-helix domain-containing protein [Polyangium sp. 6x1]|uniref:helix-turn-helix domain-containing protein n=1 Tax=Polyangium sp. 6x1 TaxID=3042689 RepID=UPI0024824415|nr:helix-turn-helix domain-containing protein [Polyangium sp. 6x1]MDI1449331.1 helix-turn-helix domain-containing protein [Polyangium sp. 6x1]